MTPDLLDDELGALAQGMDEALRAASGFTTELGRMRDGLGDAALGLDGLEKGFAGGIRRAIDGLVIDGDRLSDALRSVGLAIADTVYKAAMKPVTDQLGSLLAQGVGAMLGGAAFADGAAFAQGRVMPFAKGGVVSQATAFPMRGGTGLMGEAGPEAIMPLARGPDGRLGVQARGAAAPSVTIHVHTPDAPSFRRSQAQIAAEMGRLLSRGARNR